MIKEAGPAILKVRTGSLISLETVWTVFHPENAKVALITAEENDEAVKVPGTLKKVSK